ncbi:MAG: hypothetical protein ACK5HY_17835, partial [Parahaliea sp.]
TEVPFFASQLKHKDNLIRVCRNFRLDIHSWTCPMVLHSLCQAKRRGLIARKAEQRRMTRRVRCQWVRSALTRKVSEATDKTSSTQAAFKKKTSGQLRNLGLTLDWPPVLQFPE